MPVTYFVRMTAREGQEDAVRDLLLSNVRRILDGERGNLAFAVHRALDDPRTFWLYETWSDPAAVEEHESGPAFLAYKDAIRPLVEPDSVLFGNAEPLAALGFPLDAGAGERTGTGARARRCRSVSCARWAPTTRPCWRPSTTRTSSSTRRSAGRSAAGRR